METNKNHLLRGVYKDNLPQVFSTREMIVNGQILDKKLVTNPYRMIVSGSTGCNYFNLTNGEVNND